MARARMEKTPEAQYELEESLVFLAAEKLVERLLAPHSSEEIVGWI